MDELSEEELARFNMLDDFYDNEGWWVESAQSDATLTLKFILKIAYLVYS